MSRPEREDENDRISQQIEGGVVALIAQCQEAKFYIGTERQRKLLAALQDFLED